MKRSAILRPAVDEELLAARKFDANGANGIGHLGLLMHYEIALPNWRPSNRHSRPQRFM
jgi:hypothetical protein